MKVETTRFGTVEIDDDRVITFPDGLPGFAGKRFVLIHDERNPIVHWLQSVQESDMALLLMDPHVLVPEYVVTVKPEEIAIIDPSQNWGDSVLTRVVVRSGERPGTLFVNLFAPLLFNVSRRLAMQVPLVGSSYSVRELWPREEKGESSPAETKDAVSVK